MPGAVPHHPIGDHAWKLRFAVLLSVFVHTLGGIAATRLSVEGGDSSRGRMLAWQGPRAGPVMQIDWAPPPETAPPPPATTEPVAKHPVEPPPPPPPEPERLRLGIADSDQLTDNVIGFKEPTPHAAPDAGVDQPALDPNAGSPAPGTPTPPSPPSGGPPAPSPPTVEVPPTKHEQGPPRPEQPIADPTPPEPELHAGPRGDGEADQPAKPEVPNAPAPALDQPGIGELVFGPPAPPLPNAPAQAAQPARAKGADVVDPSTGKDTRTSPAREEVKPSPPAPAPSGAPGASKPPAPAAPQQPPGAAPSNDPLLGEMVGERSEKEADPSSKDKPIDIVLGHPAAGQGLEIITKRPRRNPFSLVTRVLALPTNPVVEVNFDRLGRVSLARIVKSSGESGVDAPVLAAVYGWRATGERLKSLPADDPDAVITVTVTILLR